MRDLITSILRPEIQEFIKLHETADVPQLVLSRKNVSGVPIAWIAQQIQGRKKAREKLPAWYATPGIVFPPSLNMEQCSSEVTARYKKGLVTGHHMADLTGGFGVDAFFLSQQFQMIDFVEPDKDLMKLARHNLAVLGASNVNFHDQTTEAFLAFHSTIYDFLYLDPSRRTTSGKLVKLEDCLPNVVDLRTKLLQQSRHILIKASPLLDLKKAYRDLGSVDQFIVLAHANECKELLISLRREAADEPTIHAVELDRDGEPTPFAFTWSQEQEAAIEFGEPSDFLYEPNSAILKAGAFRLIGQQFGLRKLNPDTHLYTSREKIRDFPGRIFKVIEEVALDKEVKAHFHEGFANILTRNYPMTVSEILKRTGLREGGERYLICARTQKHVALIAERVR